MITAGCLKFSPEGRVLISLDALPVAFNGGTPTDANGFVCTSIEDPNVYLSGLGYRNDGEVCARQGIPTSYVGGVALIGVGSLALALTEPIAYYNAGVPLVADGRVAVSFGVPPPPDAFSDGFSNGFS